MKTPEYSNRFENGLPAYEQQMLAIHRDLESGLPLQIRINDIARRLLYSENADAVDILSNLTIDACQRLAGADSRYEVDGQAVAQMYQNGALTGLYIAQQTYDDLFDVEEVLRYMPLACRHSGSVEPTDPTAIDGALAEGVKWHQSSSAAVQTMIDEWHKAFNQDDIHGDLFQAGFSAMQVSSTKMAVVAAGLQELQAAVDSDDIPWDDLLK